ncbi:hypothetical protein VTK26DRAFT_8755 [Humicola hyalothermophila]
MAAMPRIGPRKSPKKFPGFAHLQFAARPPFRSLVDRLFFRRPKQWAPRGRRPKWIKTPPCPIPHEAGDGRRSPGDREKWSLSTVSGTTGFHSSRWKQRQERERCDVRREVEVKIRCNEEVRFGKRIWNTRQHKNLLGTSSHRNSEVCTCSGGKLLTPRSRQQHFFVQEPEPQPITSDKLESMSAFDLLFLKMQDEIFTTLISLPLPKIRTEKPLHRAHLVFKRLWGSHGPGRGGGRGGG